MQRRKLWGEFTEDMEEPKDGFVPTTLKRTKLEEVKDTVPKPETEEINLEMKNGLVTQTIEVMKQTEMLTSLIDTYSTKSGTSNYLLNPCQMIPEVNFPPENSADMVPDKFEKPLWFIPPTRTRFTQGRPKNYPELTPNICRKALRKSVSGLLSMAGFTDSTESALVLMTDSVEDYIKQFIRHIRDIHDNDPRLELSNEISISTLERASLNHTGNSLLQVHNYYKRHIIEKNRSEIAEFKGVFQEYDKLMKESQNAPKEEYEETDYTNLMDDMPSTSAAAAAAAAAAGAAGGVAAGIPTGIPATMPVGVPATSLNIAEINSQPLNLDTGGMVNLMDGQLPGALKLEALEQEQNLAEQLNQYTSEAFLAHRD